MQTIVSVVLPVFGIVLCGYIAGRARVLGPASSEALNAFVYWVALPALFLRGLNRAPLDRILDWDVIVSFLGATFFIFALSLVAARLLFRQGLSAASLHALAAAFPNTGYMGVPLFTLAFGEEGSLTVIVANVSQTITIFLVAIVLVEFDRGGGPLQPRLVQIARNLVFNPLLASALLGLGLNAAGIKIDGPFDTLVQTLAAAATPCALFALGLYMVSTTATRSVAEIGWLAAMKLVLHPAVMWIAATQFFDFAPASVRDLVLTTALPTGALVFVVSQKYAVSVERGSFIVLVTTLLSLVTLSLLFVYYRV